MRHFHFEKASPPAIERPACPKCGIRMMLTRVEPDEPDHDKRTFECFECGHSKSVVVKYK